MRKPGAKYVEKHGQKLTVEERRRLVYYLTGCSMRA
jgi:hypothetical protein